ncbi:MAG TPA: branched-chain amino acid ABC transporter permease [Actinomycetota bacterium]|nr:branched-chain amino acid ABC transporter permease [Actinomycetota bacterium]
MTKTPRGTSADPRRRAGLLALACLASLAAAAPALFLTSDYRLSVAAQAMYVAILASTWSLLAGVSGQFSFAHVTIAGLGAYASAIWARDLGGAIGSVYGGIAFGTAFATAIGAVLGLLLLRLRSAYLALFTIAFAEIARLVVVAESDLTGGERSLQVPQLPGRHLAHYYLILGALGLILACTYGLLRTRYGVFLRAMREDEAAAAAMGVDVVRLKVVIFTLTSLMIGLSATLYFHTTPRLVPERLDLLFMGQVIAVAVIGGVESPLASAIGALVMYGLLENLRRIHLDASEVDALAALVASASMVGWWSLARTWRREGSALAAELVRPLAMIGASLVLLLSFLMLVPRSHGAGLWFAWLLGAAGLWGLVLSVRRAPGGPRAHRLRPLVAWTGLGTILAIRLATSGEMTWEVGVWRFAIFGALLTVTVRSFPNGLLHPALEYFSGRTRAVRDAMAAYQGEEGETG